VRVAAYNVENMFRRPKAFAVEDADRRRELLNAYTELQELFEKILYTDADKERMLKLLGVLGLRRTDESAWASSVGEGGSWLVREAGASRSSPRAGRIGSAGWS
jgi:hypothetical protein